MGLDFLGKYEWRDAAAFACGSAGHLVNRFSWKTVASFYARAVAPTQQPVLALEVFPTLGTCSRSPVRAPMDFEHKRQQWVAEVKAALSGAPARPIGRPRKARASFPVTDPLEDAPDGAVVDGFERVGEVWHPVEGCHVWDADDEAWWQAFKRAQGQLSTRGSNDP
jgi:hypothetical protein